MDFDVIVIGGGPAGLSAALMLVRSRRRVLVIDGGKPRNRFVHAMHGVLGHDGKNPADLLAEGRAEVEGYGGVIVQADVTAVASGFTVTAGETYSARRLIVATGLRDELPAIPGLEQHWGTGAFSCPYCDGWEARDARIGVISPGARSIHQVQLLRQLSDRVTYFGAASGEDLAGLEGRGITVEPTPIASVGPDLTVSLVDGRAVPIDRIFLGPQPHPIDGLLAGLGAAFVDDVVVTDFSGKTSVDGVWAVGNVASPMANVPASMGAGSMAGAAVNGDLVLEEVAATRASRA